MDQQERQDINQQLALEQLTESLGELIVNTPTEILLAISDYVSLRRRSFFPNCPEQVKKILETALMLGLSIGHFNAAKRTDIIDP